MASPTQPSLPIGRSFDALTDLAGQVRDRRAIGSVADENLGMFGITVMAMKIADAPPPAHRILGTPNRVRT